MHSNHRWLVLLVPLLLVACGSGDSSTNPEPDGPPATGEPPGLPLSPLFPRVDFLSADSTARLAKNLVQGQLNSADAVSSMGESFLQSLNGVRWDPPQGNCWSLASEGDCVLAYRVCTETSGLRWTLTLSGACGVPGEDPFQDWVSYQGSTSRDGLSGTFRKYASGTETVTSAWTWTVSVDRGSESRSFYNGDVAPSNLQATLDRSFPSQGAETDTWTLGTSRKWIGSFTEQGRAGNLKLYTRAGTPPDWALGDEVNWSAGHGYWKVYDLHGNVTGQSTW